MSNYDYNFNFKIIKRGYDPREVDPKLNELYAQIGAITKQNHALSDSVRKFDAKVRELSEKTGQIEDSLTKEKLTIARALTHAVETAEKITETAKGEAGRIIAEARSQAFGTGYQEPESRNLRNTGGFTDSRGRYQSEAQPKSNDLDYNSYRQSTKKAYSDPFAYPSDNASGSNRQGMGFSPTEIMSKTQTDTDRRCAEIYRLLDEARFEFPSFAPAPANPPSVRASAKNAPDPFSDENYTYEDFVKKMGYSEKVEIPGYGKKIIGHFGI